MKIAILGTRGIPNYHGGFEQFAEFFAVFLVEKGHDVTVYNSSQHPHKESYFKGVKIKHCLDPEKTLGTPAQFVYDLMCILDTRKNNFDIILQLGYTSSSVWHWFLPKNAVIITNMDGLEWKRSKYSRKVQTFLKYAEKLAVKSSHHLVADSIGIQAYLTDTYQKQSTYIAYGAHVFKTPDSTVLKAYNVAPYNYNMLVARLEPENNIETILDGISQANSKQTFLVVGKHDVNKFGAYLKEKYQDYPHIKFIGGVYNLAHLNNLRYFSNLYFHGHSVGGTNPSLLEAMASNALIIAHNNVFNKAILAEDAYYFKTPEEVVFFANSLNKLNNKTLITNNVNKIATKFNWEKINQAYLRLFESVLTKY
ncbi:DUF1972 domain-containing protein [Bizionia sediminis]|uniref:DUF1972 domain-containing protein n=1 Tax=Bizionia sediminis TaxID=1737064 RepID=A0ABW5KRB4_9FLAO